MNYGQVMQKIKNGLTGDVEKDREYLRGQIIEYRDHFDSREIAKSCIQMMYELTPDAKVIADSKKRALKEGEQPWRGVEADFEEARLNKFQRHYDTARQISDELVRKVEELAVFQDDDENEYKVFSEPMDELLYVALFKPQKRLRRAELPYVDIYYQNGGFNFDSRKYKEAAESFRKAIDWCPVNPMPMFEYMETLKELGDNGEYKKIALFTFKVATTPEMLAKSYRYLGHFYLTNKAWEPALVCYRKSLKYHDVNGMAQREMSYIKFRLFGKKTDYTEEETSEICREFGIPEGPDPLVISIAEENGQKYLDAEELDKAVYFFTIEQKLTKERELKDLIDELNEELLDL